VCRCYNNLRLTVQYNVIAIRSLKGSREQVQCVEILPDVMPCRTLVEAGNWKLGPAMTYITLSLSLSKEPNSLARLLSLVAIIDVFLNITLLGSVVTCFFLIWMPSKRKIVFTFCHNQRILQYYHIGENRSFTTAVLSLRTTNNCFHLLLQSTLFCITRLGSPRVGTYVVSVDCSKK
jgi:hypothetical protein